MNPSKGRSTFLKIEYIAGAGPRTTVVVGGTGGKKRMMAILREVHPEWLIQSADVIRRPSYAVKWTSPTRNKRK